MDVTGTSLFRYWNERRDADGEPLYWPGGPNGFPLRGRPKTLTEDEYENLPLSFKFRNQTFYMDDEEHRQLYQDVCERIANGLYIKQDRDRQWETERNCYRIYLEWLEPAYMIPPGRYDTPWLTEGPNNANTFTDVSQSVLGGLDPTDPELYSKLAGVPPGMQFESRRR
jgi:hypothetical protein